MSPETPKRPHFIVPPEETRCVWMTAGILSYQLCERELDCDRCPLDAALRMHFTRHGETETDAAPEPGALRARGAPRDSERRALPPDRLYTRGHCWVIPGGAGPGESASARVGIEPAFAAALPTPRSIVWPMIGESVRAGAIHLWIVVSSGVLPLAAPLDGTLRRVNPRLAESPHLLATDPLGDGWLYDVDVEKESSEKAALMKAAAATRSYDLDVRSFRADLRHALRSAGSGMPTLPDGGVPLQDVSEMLGAARYLEIVSRAFR